VSDYTPLSLAASGGYVNIIKLLLAHGAEINSRTGSKLGISPLMLAAMNGHTGMFHFCALLYEIWMSVRLINQSLMLDFAIHLFVGMSVGCGILITLFFRQLECALDCGFLVVLKQNNDYFISCTKNFCFSERWVLPSFLYPDDQFLVMGSHKWL